MVQSRTQFQLQVAIRRRNVQFSTQRRGVLAAFNVRVRLIMSLAKTFDTGPRPKASRSLPQEDRISIGELARNFEVSLRTLRFYEDRGLLTPRREGSARLYSQRDKTRLESILRCKQLGFTLNEIRAMIADAGKRPASGGFQPRQEQIKAQIAFLERQRTDIEGALSALRNEQRSLDRV